jgi:hypothetical protein
MWINESGILLIRKTAETCEYLGLLSGFGPVFHSSWRLRKMIVLMERNEVRSRSRRIAGPTHINGHGLLYAASRKSVRRGNGQSSEVFF